MTPIRGGSRRTSTSRETSETASRKPNSTGPGRPDDEPGAAGLQLRHVALANRSHHEDAVGAFLANGGLRRLRQREHGIALAVLLDRRVDPRELAAWRFDDHVERRRLSDELLRLADFDARPFGTARPEPRTAGDE